jgi:hypothetical protein
MENLIKSKIQDGVINLGAANGWNQEIIDLRNHLRENQIQGSQKQTELGRCYNEYTFESHFQGQNILVKYTVYSD